MTEEREDDLTGTGFEDEYAAETDELSFEDNERPAKAGDARPVDEVLDEQPARRVQHAGLTGAAELDHESTDDDLSPETLMPEDGARSPNERGSGKPNDVSLRKVREDEIGEGKGLDEAELGRAKPLDGKPWDGPAQ